MLHHTVGCVILQFSVAENNNSIQFYHSLCQFLPLYNKDITNISYVKYSGVQTSRKCCLSLHGIRNRKTMVATRKLLYCVTSISLFSTYRQSIATVFSTNYQCVTYCNIPWLSLSPRKLAVLKKNEKKLCISDRPLFVVQLVLKPKLGTL